METNIKELNVVNERGKSRCKKCPKEQKISEGVFGIFTATYI